MHKSTAHVLLSLLILTGMTACDGEPTPAERGVRSVEIRVVLDDDATLQLIEDIDRFLLTAGDSSTFAFRPDQQTPDELRPVGPLKSVVHIVHTDHGWRFFVSQEDMPKFREVLYADSGRDYPMLREDLDIPGASGLNIMVTHDPVGENSHGEYHALYVCSQDPVLNRNHVEDAVYEMQRLPDRPEDEYPVVLLELNETGAELFQRMTSQNIGQRIAMLIDDYVYTAPVVQDTVSGGRCLITGTGTPEETESLASAIRQLIANN